MHAARSEVIFRSGRGEMPGTCRLVVRARQLPYLETPWAETKVTTQQRPLLSRVGELLMTGRETGQDSADCGPALWKRVVKKGEGDWEGGMW